MKHPSLSKLLDSDDFPSFDTKDEYEKRLAKLQSRMLSVQQGLFHSKQRAIIAFEGFDAAGKGGAIRRLTENLDPRGFRVLPIGPPTPDEQGRHYLYRFWRDLPAAGTISIFDRTWYGRVLVERVEGFASKDQWKRAYREINEFERLLVDDGVDVIKIFFAISKKEQRRRFEERLENPHKQWKIGEPDVEARKRWDDYVQATDDMLERTDTSLAHWNLIPGDHKWWARVQTLEIVTDALARHGKWLEEHASEKKELRHITKALKKIG